MVRHMSIGDHSPSTTQKERYKNKTIIIVGDNVYIIIICVIYYVNDER